MLLTKRRISNSQFRDAHWMLTRQSSLLGIRSLLWLPPLQPRRCFSVIFTGSPRKQHSRSNGLTTSCRDMQSLAYATNTSANSRARSRAFSAGSKKALVGLANVASTCFSSASICELCTLSASPSVCQGKIVRSSRPNERAGSCSRKAEPYPPFAAFACIDHRSLANP